MKLATLLWLLLLGLTALSTQASVVVSAGAVVPLVLLLTLIKGGVVIDHFMALRHAGAPWRWIVLGWLVLVLGLIGYAFHLPAS